MTITDKQIEAFLNTMVALADAIRELGSVPTGQLYVQVCGHLSLNDFNAVIDRLLATKFVAQKGHVLTWVGPAKTD